MISFEYIERVKEALKSRVEEVCAELLKGGKRVKNAWQCGGTDGGPGKSMTVEIEGPKAGVWHDHATGEAGDLLELFMAVRGLKFPEAVQHATDFLGVTMPAPEDRRVDPSNFHVEMPAPARDLDAPPPYVAPAAKVATAFDWDQCVKDFTPEKAAELANWRNLSPEFVQQIHSDGLIGVYRGNFALPVVNASGAVIRCHYRFADGKGWSYYPKGDDNTPLIIGDLATAGRVLAFESQWDAFAMLDAIGWHEGEGHVAAIVTRGATSNTDFSSFDLPQIIAVPQNDQPEKKHKTTGRTPAEEWLERIRSSKKASTRLLVASVPPEHKDFNDFVKAEHPSRLAVEKLLRGARSKLDIDVVRGFLSFPTDPPPEDVLLGNAFGRVGDIGFLNSGAGYGKSVVSGGCSIAWPLGLPYLGIRPSRPLKVIHFCGEDDASTIGQIREGFLLHSKEVVGHQLKAEDLKCLNEMVRTDFSREFTGDAFLTRLNEMLTEEHADVVLINPLLSFIGGDIVEQASDFLRKGLMPILKRHRTLALIAHHTCKLSKASWDEMDFTYSGIGGGEVANVPRFILTLAPTKTSGLCAVHVSKRKTTGWKDGDGRPIDHVFVKRTDDSTRPAWLPVSHAAAQQLLMGSTEVPASRKKVNTEHVVAALSTGAMKRTALIDWLCRQRTCGEKTADSAIKDAQLSRDILGFSEPNPRGGLAVKWLRLPGQLEQLNQVAT